MMMRIVALLVCLLMFGLIYPVNAADLTVNQLHNSNYLIPSWENQGRGEWVQLRNGEFSRRNRDNPLFVKIVKVALGSLSDGKTTDGAVIYGYNTGGSGSFMVLGAVVNDRGKPREIALTDLGDRVKVNSLSLKGGKIIVNLVTHGPNDPSCCPTVKKIATYRLVGNKLVEE